MRAELARQAFQKWFDLYDVNQTSTTLRNPPDPGAGLDINLLQFRRRHNLPNVTYIQPDIASRPLSVPEQNYPSIWTEERPRR